MCVCVYIYIYIYIYTEVRVEIHLRALDVFGEGGLTLHLSIYIELSICMYIYIYIRTYLDVLREVHVCHHALKLRGELRAATQLELCDHRALGV